MCGRFVMDLPPDLLAATFGLREVPHIHPSYNIAPTQPVAVIRRDSEQNRLVMLTWGLVPSWAKDQSKGSRLINARAETAAEKPSFRQALRHRRCLIAARAFYEWRQEGQHKIPQYIHRKDNAPLGLAGIWEVWRTTDGSLLETCAILTTTANALLAPLHDRMPVILPPEGYAAWLDPQCTNPEQLTPFYQPFPAHLLELYPVSDRVNSPRHNSPENIVRVSP